jgi:hypothetical protein
MDIISQSMHFSNECLKKERDNIFKLLKFKKLFRTNLDVASE